MDLIKSKFAEENVMGRLTNISFISEDQHEEIAKIYCVTVQKRKEGGGGDSKYPCDKLYWAWLNKYNNS